MAVTAQIQIDAGSGWVTGSNDNVALDTLTSYRNLDDTDVTTWEWSLLTQPTGTQDNFEDSSTLVSNLAVPSIRLKKEGSYLLRLIVNKGQITEAQDQVIVAIRELATGDRIPAAGETVEGGGALYGWSKEALDKILRRVTRLADSGMFIAYANEAMTAGDVVHAGQMVTIATGLPGERLMPSASKALASDITKVDGPLGVVVSDVAGNSAISMGELCRVMVIGELHAQTLAGSPAVGDAVYVNNSANLSITPGDYIRQVGDVAADLGGGLYDVAISAGANSIPRGNAGGDLSGGYPDPTVAKINGTTISTAGGALATGAVLRVTGGSTADWGAVDLSALAAVTGTLPVTKGGTGTAIGPNVYGVMYGTPSASYSTTLASPNTNRFLRGNNAGAPTWDQVSLASNDVTGTLPVTKGGTGTNIPPTQYGLIYAQSNSEYASISVGATGTVLCGTTGGAPTWGTVPTAAFASVSIPQTALQASFGFGNALGSVTIPPSSAYTSVATTTDTYYAGYALISMQPAHSVGISEIYAVNASGSTDRTVRVKIAQTGANTKVWEQQYRITKNTTVTIPPFSVMDTITAGSTTLTLSISTDADVTAHITNITLNARQL